MKRLIMLIFFSFITYSFGYQVEENFTGQIVKKYENGQVQSIENFKNGKLYGEFKEFYKDGTLAQIGSFKSGDLENIKAFYENGNLKFENRDLQFYQLVPLYDEEYNFALKNGMKNLLLLDVEKKINYVVDMQREKVLEYSEDEKELQDDIMDSSEWHLGDYYLKGIEVDEINVYNHLAIFLRWAMENSFLSDNFLKAYGKELKKYTSQDFIDLREFVKYRLKGDLRKSFFNDVGKEFIRYYYDYDFDDGDFFPGDIDNYAKRIFGEERYYSPELKREAYLYLNFDEKYYQDMKEIIDKVYNKWLKELENYSN